MIVHEEAEVLTCNFIPNSNPNIKISLDAPHTKSKTDIRIIKDQGRKKAQRQEQPPIQYQNQNLKHKNEFFY